MTGNDGEQHSCITCGQWLSNKFEDFCSGECWDIYYGVEQTDAEGV